MHHHGLVMVVWVARFLLIDRIVIAELRIRCNHTCEVLVMDNCGRGRPVVRRLVTCSFHHGRWAPVKTMVDDVLGIAERCGLPTIKIRRLVSILMVNIAVISRLVSSNFIWVKYKTGLGLLLQVYIEGEPLILTYCVDFLLVILRRTGAALISHFALRRIIFKLLIDLIHHF